MSPRVSQRTAELRETLERQAPLALTIPNCVHVIGVGGVGSWVALFLALAGVPRLILWDADDVSRNNLNRLPVGPDNIGRLKGQAMQRIINNLAPRCSVTPLTLWTPTAMDDLHITDLDALWLVGCTDSWDSRRQIFEYAQANGIDYIEASAEGEFGGCTGEPADFATPDEANPGYASVPVWVGPCVSAAMMACAHILHDSSPGPSNYRLGWAAGLLAFQHDHALATTAAEVPAPAPEEGTAA